MGQFSSCKLILSHPLERLVCNQKPRETFNVFFYPLPPFFFFSFLGFFLSSIILPGISYRKLACCEGFFLKGNDIADISLTFKVSHLTTRCSCMKTPQREAKEKSSVLLSCSGTKAGLPVPCRLPSNIHNGTAYALKDVRRQTLWDFTDR